MTRVEFENIAGRAGRLGFSKAPGRAIIVEPSEWEREILFKRLITGPMDSLQPALAHRPMTDSVLRVAAMVPGFSEERLRATLLDTWSGSLSWASAPDEFQSNLGAAILTLEKAGVLQREGEGWQLSAAGRIAAAGGIAAATAQSFALWCAGRPSAELVPLLAMLTRTEEGVGTYIRASKDERFGRAHTKLLKAMASARALEDPEVRTLIETAEALIEPVVNAVKRCVILLEWLDEKPLREIEEAHYVGGGAIQRLGEEMAWLARTLAAMAKASGWAGERVEELRRLAERMRIGVREELLDLAECRIPGIGRAALRTLFNAGFETTDAVRTAGVAKLTRAVGKRRADRLATHFGTSTTRRPSSDDLCIELGVVEGRVAATARGKVKPLRESQLFALLLFAMARREKDGWVPSRLVDSDKDNARRYICRARDKFAELLGVEKEQVMQNDHQLSYCLLLKPAQVRIDVRALRSVHPHIVKEVEDALGL
jgi:replicative superfamily II helicase